MKPRVGVVDHVPHIRQQRSIQDIWPKDATGYHDEPRLNGKTVHVPSDHLGRVPIIGLDSGAIPGSRPDRNT